MNQFTYLDKDSNEVSNILNGKKDIIIRAANIKKFPFKMINKGDTLYLLQNDNTSKVYGKANIKETMFLETTLEDRIKIISKYKDRVLLSDKRIEYISDRKYLSVFFLEHIEPLDGTLDTSLHKIEEDFVKFIPTKK